MADANRLDAFERAIREVVRPGTVVVDLGSGTGILGLLACRAGAVRVYSIETTSLISVAEQICRVNGYSDRVSFVRGNSRKVSIPELADVVVGDQIGSFGFEAGLFEYFRDARLRLLKPSGKCIPASIAFFAAPVEHSEARADVDFWQSTHVGFDFRPAQPIATNNIRRLRLSVDHLLADPVKMATFDPSEPLGGPLVMGAAIRVSRPGTMDGIGCWFSASLSSGVHMTNSPLCASRIDRDHAFFPIGRRINVEVGDEIAVAFRAHLASEVVAWNVSVSSSKGKLRFSHSTFDGMPLSKDDLERTRPAWRPTLPARGRALRTALELCDGERAVADIERELLSRYPELFDNLDESATFVAEVMNRHTR